jgi:hypothetical protein
MSKEGERFESYAHAKEALFDYIEVFYNQRNELCAAIGGQYNDLASHVVEGDPPKHSG